MSKIKKPTNQNCNKATFHWEETGSRAYYEIKPCLWEHMSYADVTLTCRLPIAQENEHADEWCEKYIAACGKRWGIWHNKRLLWSVVNADRWCVEIKIIWISEAKIDLWQSNVRMPYNPPHHCIKFWNTRRCER